MGLTFYNIKFLDKFNMFSLVDREDIKQLKAEIFNNNKERKDKCIKEITKISDKDYREILYIDNFVFLRIGSNYRIIGIDNEIVKKWKQQNK